MQTMAMMSSSTSQRKRSAADDGHHLCVRLDSFEFEKRLKLFECTLVPRPACRAPASLLAGILSNKIQSPYFRRFKFERVFSSKFKSYILTFKGLSHFSIPCHEYPYSNGVVERAEAISQ